MLQTIYCYKSRCCLVNPAMVMVNDINQSSLFLYSLYLLVDNSSKLTIIPS